MTRSTLAASLLLFACSSSEHAPLAGNGKHSDGSSGAAGKFGGAGGLEEPSPGEGGSSTSGGSAPALGGANAVAQGGSSGGVTGLGGASSTGGAPLASSGGSASAGSASGGSATGGTAGAASAGSAGSAAGGPPGCVKNTCETPGSGLWRCGDSSDNCGGILHCPTTCPEGGTCGVPGGPAWLCNCYKSNDARYPCNKTAEKRDFVCFDSGQSVQPALPNCVLNPEDEAGNHWCCQ